VKIERIIGRTCQLALAIWLCATSVALSDGEHAAQDGTNGYNVGWAPRRGAQNGRMNGEPGGERLLDRLLSNTNLAAEIGLDEETIAKLREETHALKDRQVELTVQIQKLSLKQADLMPKLMSAPDANADEIMNTIDAIGKLRTEQAKLMVQNLITVRKYLTPAQISKAREKIRAQMRENNEARPAK